MFILRNTEKHKEEEKILSKIFSDKSMVHPFSLISKFNKNDVSYIGILLCICFLP